MYQDVYKCIKTYKEKDAVVFIKFYVLFLLSY